MLRVYEYTSMRMYTYNARSNFIRSLRSTASINRICAYLPLLVGAARYEYEDTKDTKDTSWYSYITLGEDIVLISSKMCRVVRLWKRKWSDRAIIIHIGRVE